MRNAKEYYRVSRHCACCLAAISSLALYLSLQDLLNLYTSDEEVRAACIGALPLACLTVIFDQGQVYLQGIIKALGIQDRAVKVTVIGYILLYGPLAYCLAFKTHLGFSGVWAALLATMYFMTMWLHQIIEQANWYRAIRDAAARLNNPNNHNHDLSFKSFKSIDV